METLWNWFRKRTQCLFMLMLVTGLTLAIYAASSFIYTYVSQAHLEKEFEDASSISSNSTEAMPDLAAFQPEQTSDQEGLLLTNPPKQGSPVFRLEIPKIKLDNIVLYGSDDATLKKGPGVVEDTSLPWLGSNTSIGGHRDTFFYRFGELGLGDEVRVVTKDKTILTYKISKISIVEQEEVSVMDPTPVPSLTLITCWPLRFIGPSPQRLIVQAEIILN